MRVNNDAQGHFERDREEAGLVIVDDRACGGLYECYHVQFAPLHLHLAIAQCSGPHLMSGRPLR